MRLHKRGLIRRLSWGLYDYPKKHPKLGELPPDIEQVVEAIARKDCIKTLPSGAYAANVLGLSQQVPAKVVYLTDGLSKKVRAGNRAIIFKATTPKNMATAGTFAGLAIQALKYLGKDHVDEGVLIALKKKLGAEEKKSLKKYLHFGPVWIQKIFSTLLGGNSRG